MKAVRYSEHGGPEVLALVDVPEPHAGPGQVRVAVRAAGVNGIDWKIRAGFLRDVRATSFPAGTGNDAAGVVDEVGEGVTGVAVGDEVFGSGADTYAEYAVLTSWAVKPAGLSFAEAAGYPIAVETAIRILDAVGAAAGQTLLVSGASGGVGSAAVQIARQRGLTVIGTAGEKNQDYVRSLGATATTYGPGLVERVRALAPGGIDAALDIAGSGVIPELIELTGDPATVVSIADFSAPQHGAQVSTGGDGHTAAFAEAARLFSEGAFSIPVARTYQLAEAGAAQAASAEGHIAGRTVITVG
jgi:NADPH:quinone reductase-like Zn-dependent oxidoreductase